jgi:uncharacterized RDD family membrane protein YckC
MLCRNHVDVSENVRRCARCGTPFCSDCLVDIQGRPYCAVCKSEQLLDVRSGVDRSELQLAGNGKRFAAIFIDNLITFVPFYALFLVVMFTSAKAGGGPNPFIFLLYIPMFAAPLLYEALMLQMKDGQTLGKMAMRVKVVRPDGSPLTSGQAWGRAGMRTVLGCIWIGDYIPAFFTKEKTTLHDMIAGTRVVET